MLINSQSCSDNELVLRIDHHESKQLIIILIKNQRWLLKIASCGTSLCFVKLPTHSICICKCLTNTLVNTLCTILVLTTSSDVALVNNLVLKYAYLCCLPACLPINRLVEQCHRFLMIHEHEHQCYAKIKPKVQLKVA